MKWLQFLSALLAIVPFASPTLGQNVSAYGMMPDPFLFLLREPAVHADVGLSAQQKQKLIQLNDSFDGILLAARNMQSEEGQKRVAEVMAQTRQHVSRMFSREQKTRLDQIAFQLRGLSFVLLPQLSEQLRLSDQQTDDIEAIVESTWEKIREVQADTYQGPEAHQEMQQSVNAARRKEQETILAALDDRQKRQVLTLVGRSFDSNTLGRVSFKAPELSAGDEWINSEPLQLKNLRGKVVALHFWTFG